MEPTFFQFGIQSQLSQLFYNLPYNCNVIIFIIINIDKNIVQIYNDEDVGLFGKDFIDIFLETC